MTSPRNRLPVLALLALAACGPPSIPARATIDEPRFLDFRCVREEPAGDGTAQVGLPIEGCGCVERLDDGAFRTLGRIECTCRVNVVEEGELVERRVPYVAGAGGRPVRDEATGDWTPVASQTPGAVACEPRGSGELRGYVGATGRGEVAVLDLGDDDEIDDVDPTIPGTTAIFVDDLISDVGAHPYGDFVFTVNSSTGSLSVIRDDRRVRPSFVADVADEPLLDAVVFPSAEATLLEGPRRAARAWISAPTGGRIYEIDLDALATADEDAGDVVARVIDLVPAAPGTSMRPGRLAIDEDGRTLYVAHADAPRFTAVDLEAPARQTTVSFTGERACEDPYLVGLVDVVASDVCADGIDNDGDGTVDASDPDCAAGWENWEGDARVPACSRVAECGDGIDNDGDGLVDAADDDCPATADATGCTPIDRDGDGVADLADADCNAAFRWERPTPACANGADDDGDGRIDRDDPDCRDEADDNEGGRETGDAACTDEADNDGDGLVDAEDPGCSDPEAAARYDFERTPECGDRRDADGDGRTDFPEDLDCYAASDGNEGGDAVQVGPAAIVAARVPVGGGARSFVYTLDRSSGDLFVVETDATGWPIAGVRPTRVRAGGVGQNLALRQFGYEASLILVDDQATLRSVEITAPQHLVDQDGREVYARLVTRQGGRCPIGEREIAGFYVVEDGLAWAVESEALRPFEGQCTRNDRVALPLPANVPGVQSRVPGGAATPVPFAVIDPDASVVTGRGATDPPVLLGGDRPARRVLHDQINVLRSALTRTTAALDPALRIDGSSAAFDPARLPGFCRVESPLEQSTCLNGRDDDGDDLIDAADEDCADGGSEGEPAAACENEADDDGDGLVDAEDPGCGPTSADDPTACLVSGYNADGRPEATSQFLERTTNFVDALDGIQVVEDDPLRVPAGRWAVRSEGVLPRTDSRSGQFGGRSDDGGNWTLLDYNQDFCRVGVQPGDVILVDRFIPATPDDIVVPLECNDLQALPADRQALCQRRSTCRQLQLAAEVAAAQRQLEPLRYEIVELTAHKLLLRAEERSSYAPQVSADPRQPLPQPAVAPPIPYASCAAEFISYRVRAGNGQWVLTINDSTHPHPYVNRDGQCVADPRLVDQRRLGRFRLGEPFENTWLRFRMGHVPFRDAPAGARPFQVGVGYEFTVVPGVAFATLPDVAILPQEMRWLPFDDRLYVVDSAFETVVEIGGTDVQRIVDDSYLNVPSMRVIRRFE